MSLFNSDDRSQQLSKHRIYGTVGHIDASPKLSSAILAPTLFGRADQKDVKGGSIAVPRLKFEPPKELLEKIDSLVNKISKLNGKGMQHFQRNEQPRGLEVLREAEQIVEQLTVLYGHN